MTLLCSPFFFKYRFSFFIFFLMWPNHHHFFLFVFFKLFDSNVFFLLVNRLSNKSANHRYQVTLWKKKFAPLRLKGVTKDDIFFFLMIKKHGHTSFPKHDYLLFQEVSTQEKIWFMLQVVPYFYSCSFFKPPFQVFSQTNIFYFHVKRFADSMLRTSYSFYVIPPWNKRSRLYSGNVME